MPEKEWGRQEPGEPYRRVSVDEARAMMDEAPESRAVVDVRRPDEWNAGHVAGALHIQVDDLPGRIDELPREKELLFICSQGVRSGLAAEMASSMGFAPERLFNVEEGTQTWIDRGYPAGYGAGEG